MTTRKLQARERLIEWLEASRSPTTGYIVLPPIIASGSRLKSKGWNPVRPETDMVLTAALDRQVREAVVGGDTILDVVVRHRGPVIAGIILLEDDVAPPVITLKAPTRVTFPFDLYAVRVDWILAQSERPAKLLCRRLI